MHVYIYFQTFLCSPLKIWMKLVAPAKCWDLVGTVSQGLGIASVWSCVEPPCCNQTEGISEQCRIPGCMEPLGLWNVLETMEHVIPGCFFLAQISILLFATLYILCHIFLTRFKRPAEFTTGTFDLPAFSQSSSCHGASPRGMGDGACWERSGGCAGLFETLAAQPRPSTSREIGGKALISFLLLNYFICIYFKLEDKIMTK